MRYLVIILSLVTIVLAVMLAAEGQWFIAVPDAIFGVGVGFFAWESLREERHPPSAPPLAAPPGPPTGPEMPPPEPPPTPVPQPAPVPPRRPRRRR